MTTRLDTNLDLNPAESDIARFRHAIHLVDTGQTDELDVLLGQHPAILVYRSYGGEWYEQGYFKGSTLLHHVAGNPIRCPLPENIADVTRVLLAHGADPNALCGEPGNEWTTIGLILTGKQVSDAGVGVALIDILKAAGAKDDLDDADILSHPLWNCGRATAEELARRGARMDLRHAAALGRIDVMASLITTATGHAMMEEALIFACQQGEIDAATWLIGHGAKGDALINSSSPIPVHAARATALHMAAYYGHAEIVKGLLAGGAHATAIDPTYGGTAIDWAEHGGHPEIAAMLKDDLAALPHPDTPSPP